MGLTTTGVGRAWGEEEEDLSSPPPPDCCEEEEEGLSRLLPRAVPALVNCPFLLSALMLLPRSVPIFRRLGLCSREGSSLVVIRVLRAVLDRERPPGFWSSASMGSVRL